MISEPGDLLITCKGTIGEMAINNFGQAHIARQIMAIRNIFGLDLKYLSLCVGFYANQIRKAAKGLIPGISRENLLDLILPMPPLNYQTRVVACMELLTNTISSIDKSLN